MGISRWGALNTSGSSSFSDFLLPFLKTLAQHKQAAMPAIRATPTTTPTTIPAIAPPERPEESLVLGTCVGIGLLVEDWLTDALLLSIDDVIDGV